MNYEELMSIKVIPKDIAKSQSKSLVNNLYHTPYKDEIRLFSCIKQGNLKKLIFEMTQLGIQNITVGQMSDDELKQQKYMAVSFITLATRYAIQGGMNENLTVNSVAKYSNLSSDYLSRIFKEEMGVNLSAYITHQKLEMSQTLLFEGYDSDNICYLLGFSSQSHYISLFKKEYGITPGEFVALTR